MVYQPVHEGEENIDGADGNVVDVSGDVSHNALRPVGGLCPNTSWTLAKLHAIPTERLECICHQLLVLLMLIVWGPSIHPRRQHQGAGECVIKILLTSEGSTGWQSYTSYNGSGKFSH